LASGWTGFCGLDGPESDWNFLQYHEILFEPPRDGSVQFARYFQTDQGVPNYVVIAVELFQLAADFGRAEGGKRFLPLSGD
jgi:hypothetical protein